LRVIRAHRSVYDAAIMERMDWTDGRLQERFEVIDRRFDEVDRRFEQVDQRFEQVDRRFDKVDSELQAINSRFDALQRTMIQTSAIMIAALIGLIATQL